MEEKNKFDNFDNGNPFKTPDSYFEDFEKNIYSKIQEVNNNKKQIIRWKQPLAIAASFAILIGLFFFLQPTKHPVENAIVSTINSDNISDSEVLESLDEIEISDDLISEVVSDNNLDYEIYNTLFEEEDFEEEIILAEDL